MCHRSFTTLLLAPNGVSNEHSCSDRFFEDFIVHWRLGGVCRFHTRCRQFLCSMFLLRAAAWGIPSRCCAGGGWACDQHRSAISRMGLKLTRLVSACQAFYPQTLASVLSGSDVLQRVWFVWAIFQGRGGLHILRVRPAGLVLWFSVHFGSFVVSRLGDFQKSALLWDPLHNP